MKKVILSILVAIVLVQTVSAFTFINIFIDETGEAIFVGETSELSLNLPEGIENINGEISGLTQILTSKEENTWTFSYSLQDSELNIFLPKRARVISISSGEIGLSDGRIVIFTKDTITVSYSISPIQGEKTSLNIPLLLLFIAILIILIAYVINYSKREKKEDDKHPHAPTLSKPSKTHEQNKLKIIEQLLSEREKLIISKLKQTGKIKSSQLRKLTDIPKASFSRHLQELEKKKLIKRTGEGKNKFVQLGRR